MQLEALHKPEADIEVPYISGVVEGKSHRFTVRFAPAARPVHRTDTCEVFVIYDEGGRKLALKRPQLAPQSQTYERDLRVSLWANRITPLLINLQAHRTRNAIMVGFNPRLCITLFGYPH